MDIWLWKLKAAALNLITHHKGRTRPGPGKGYDHFYIYAHRFCLTSAEEVRSAPDSVLFEMMGLEPSRELGWLQFITREFGWHSMIAADWGHPVLKIPDGVGRIRLYCGARGGLRRLCLSHSREQALRFPHAPGSERTRLHPPRFQTEKGFPCRIV